MLEMDAFFFGMLLPQEIEGPLPFDAVPLRQLLYDNVNINGHSHLDFRLCLRMNLQCV